MLRSIRRDLKIRSRIMKYLTLEPLRNRRLLAASDLFDTDWYAARYPDVAKAGVNPIDHYLRRGWIEGRTPGPRFDPDHYLKSNPDVARAAANPLVHYLRHGIREGRSSSGLEPQGNEMALISESGLFDESWYRTTYPDVQESGMDPLRHYLDYGAKAGRAPSPLFDTADYLKRHIDVAASGKNPLRVFLEVGEQEQRYAQSIYNEPSEDRWGASNPIPLLHAVRGRPTIAVVVHVYYIDVFEEICEYLKNIPYHFNLLITTPIQAHVQEAKDIVQRSGLDATTFVKLSENKGRNFAPFLVEFPELIQQHELMLHLHTKKSLHNGPEAIAWRSHLCKSLVGNKYLVKSIIDSFVDSNVGVLFPNTYSWLPYWAHHWLSNSHLIDAFYERLSIPYSRPLEYIDFPVGSMFWARTRALKPLLAARWSYDDFPAECGQNDGTVAHVIERSIVTVAKSQGYGFVEVDYEAGCFRHNWSRKSLHQYARRTRGDLYGRIRAADVVSFDIFDTLITRRILTPDSLQQYMGWLLARCVPGLDDFFAVRKESEELARKRKHYKEDVNLDEIYAAFPITASWTPETIAQAKQLELDCEKRSFVPRHDLLEALRYARTLNKRIVAVSDTYFSRVFVEQLLASFGILDLFDDIYLSSERGTRKDRGDMWDLLFASEHLSSNRLLHIGDNEHSDAQLPGDRRLETFHVMSPAALMAHSGISIPSKRCWFAEVALGLAASRHFNSPFLPDQRFRPLNLTTARDFGYIVFGPLLFGFFSWLFTHPALKSLDHFYFLSREGFFLYGLFQKLQKALGRPSPRATYFYASRRAAIAAAQGVKFDPSEITFGCGFRGTVSELLRTRLGLHLPEEFDLNQTEILLPDDTDYVNSVLTLLEPYIVEHGRRELEALQQYCRQNGITDEQKLAIVDIGYSGSIQKALQTVLGRGVVGFYIATVQPVARVEEAKGFAWGCFAERESFATTRCAVLRHGRILESYLTAPHGQVLRFENQKNGYAEPVFKANGFSQSVFPTLSEINDGVNAYFDDLLAAFGPDVFLKSPDLKTAQLTFEALVEHRIVLPSDVVNALYLEDDFCGNSELKAGDLAVRPDSCVGSLSLGENRILKEYA
jgi:FMN phosphatase YigB (HAD superfamily)